jgi:sulfate adenylyltransferase subunit 1
VLVKHGTSTVQAVIARIDSRYDLDALTHEPADTLSANDIGRARLRLAAELPLEPYRVSRESGSFLVIHPSDGATLAAGIARD